MTNNEMLHKTEVEELENQEQWVGSCHVCDKDQLLVDMVYTADRYICSTKECILGALEQLNEELEMAKGTLQACR